ncbi:MAG: T9SS type A sorting domain-containing protein [Bacteroidetes bacterium]|nr:T9SS type A sorting domain-containing protein [Bacteroidota bacterium]
MKEFIYQWHFVNCGNQTNMKRIILLLAVLLITATASDAQIAKTRVVLIQAEVESAPAHIKLSWDNAAGSLGYTVYRKAPGDWTWQEQKALGATDTVFTDTTVHVGQVYEYLVDRQINGAHLYGQIACGIEVEAIHYRGEVFIAVDSALNASIPDALHKFYMNLVGDGWRVNPVVTSANWTVPDLKDTIKAWHLLNPHRHNSLLLLGNIPVPYSGNLNPDAHPDHKGAWPADVFYGEFNYSWTDVGTYTDATRAANINLPGDGKYDQTIIPGELGLQIGRVYLDDLGTLGLGRDSLYTRYLEKDQSFRMNEWNVPRRGLVDDVLNALGGEYPGRNGFQNANAMFGIDGCITSYDTFINILRTEPYLFSHASSTGGFTSNKQLNSTMFKLPTYSVFQTSFGSYHGDWNNSNNLLRAEIAGPGYGLTSVWAGRPQWHFHTMTMGYPIGYSAWLTQNNFIDGNHQTYDPGYGAGWVHVTLMGDPTLRLHMMNPASNLSAQSNSSEDAVTLTWNASSDPEVIGYMVYRSDSLFGIWNQVNTSAVSGNSLTDDHPLPGNNVYMVRALKLEKSAGGSYFNMSQGTFTWVTAKNGDGSITNTVLPENLKIRLYPNPSNGIFIIEMNDFEPHEIEIYDLTSKMIHKQRIAHKTRIDLSAFPGGIYIVRCGDISQKIVLSR